MTSCVVGTRWWFGICDVIMEKVRKINMKRRHFSTVQCWLINTCVSSLSIHWNWHTVTLLLAFSKEHWRTLSSSHVYVYNSRVWMSCIWKGLMRFVHKQLCWNLTTLFNQRARFPDYFLIHQIHFVKGRYLTLHSFIGASLCYFFFASLCAGIAMSRYPLKHSIFVSFNICGWESGCRHFLAGVKTFFSIWLLLSSWWWWWFA